MFHNLNLQQKNTQKELLLQCRKNIFKTIQNKIPLNESPSFYYCPQGSVVYTFSKEDQKDLTQKINEALIWGVDFTCCLCLKTQEEYGFVLLKVNEEGIEASYQRPPNLIQNEYVFEDPIKIGNPLLSLSFLFKKDENVVYH